MGDRRARPRSERIEREREGAIGRRQEQETEEREREERARERERKDRERGEREEERKKERKREVRLSIEAESRHQIENPFKDRNQPKSKNLPGCLPDTAGFASGYLPGCGVFDALQKLNFWTVQK